MSRILFVRHAQTAMAGRFCGQSDPDLNPEGRGQSARLAQLLAAEPIDAVYSSDLRRARSTAEAIAATRDCAIHLRPALREIRFGKWEGLSWKQIEQADGQYAEAWMAAYPNLAAPDGEIYSDFERRVLAELKHLKETATGTVAVVTHAGVLRVVLQHWFGCTERDAWQKTQPYCCVLRYTNPRGENP